MSLPNRKVKGYIFRTQWKGRYYAKFNQGTVTRREAHVYTAEDARAFALECFGWGGKEEGKWIIVYE